MVPVVKQRRVSWWMLAILSQSIVIVTPAFRIPTWNALAAARPSTENNVYRDSSTSTATTTKIFPCQSKRKPLMSSQTDDNEVSSAGGAERDMDKNSLYISGLMENLGKLCDKYIMNGSPLARKRVINVLDQIASESVNQELVKQSIRMVKRAGVPMEKSFVDKFDKVLGKTDIQQRREDGQLRKEWEAQRSTSELGSEVADNINGGNGDISSNSNSGGRSALSRREAKNGKPDLFMSSVVSPDSIRSVANDKEELEKEMNSQSNDQTKDNGGNNSNNRSQASSIAAANRVSELIARAGSGSSFEGETLGIGGLDEVLAQVKRRVWTPLAAPPQLLHELGIHPVRGLLLYGRPGCGKTLLARTLGQILSPMRPISVVSGPEIMDKFVGSSEKNLRDIFDNPPDIYDTYRLGEADGGTSIAEAALHVVVMDEFDAVARARGGRGGKGDQGDAGVARDSVVNQLLAKMDGVQPLPVPTLVIGLTNKRSLVEPALLRPGRFEVQIEVPPPRTNEQRVSILKVHTKSMNRAGRLLINDPPSGTAASRYIQEYGSDGLVSYDDLLEEIARRCDGYSGAALAGVARAAASHALERAVNEFSESLLVAREEAEEEKLATSNDQTRQPIKTTRTTTPSEHGPSLMVNCLIIMDDFEEAILDVLSSTGSSDYEELPEKENDDDDDDEQEENDNSNSSNDNTSDG